MMIYSVVLLSLSVIVVSIEGSHLPYLRTTTEGKSNDDTTTSNCNNLHDPEHCFRTTDTTSGNACMWCIAGAIPSECMSPNQASLLPPDVFDCAAPGVTTSEEATTIAKTSFRFDSVIFGTTQIYSLVHDNHDSHSSKHDNENDEKRETLKAHTPPQPSKSDLCDASSNSLSGYVDISGSEYDKGGENKHLFYWFFEKRGTALLDADTPVSIDAFMDMCAHKALFLFRRSRRPFFYSFISFAKHSLSFG